MPPAVTPAAVDLARIKKLEQDGLVSTQKHPTLDLLIHNYTQRCQFSKAWDDLTLQCRGLITDTGGRIVARPFRKFFNLSEHLGHEASGHDGFTLPPLNWGQEFVCTRKHDGSLGILYFGDSEPRLATRGSFVSDQAVRGTDIFRARGYHRFDYPRELTFLWEIIFPQNRIVLDYGDREDCILLDVIDTETGKSVGQHAIENLGRRIGCPVAETIPATPETLIACSSANVPNEEGYVVRFEDGTRIKIKFEEYVRLHRLVTGVNARTIWELLMHGQPLDELLDRVPDEFMEWVKQTAADLTGQFDNILAFASGFLQGLKERAAASAVPWTRKDFALEIVQLPDAAAVVFALLNGHDPAPIIWKKLRPVATTPFRSDSANA